MYMVEVIPSLIHSLDDTKSIERCTLSRYRKKLQNAYDEAKIKYTTHTAAVTNPEVVKVATETAKEIVKVVGLEAFARALGEHRKRTPPGFGRSRKSELHDQLEHHDNEAAANLLWLRYGKERPTKRPRTAADAAPTPYRAKPATSPGPSTPDLQKVTR